MRHLRYAVILLLALAALVVGGAGASPGTTERVSVDSAGNEGNDESNYGALSADGRYVAFHSYATNLVPADTNNRSDVFVHDRQTGATSRVSVDSAGNQGNNSSLAPDISADGRFVAFDSSASNLVLGDPDGNSNISDIFVHDRDTDADGIFDEVGAIATERVSEGNAGSERPAISADGRYVTFRSNATNLVAGDTNNRSDIFVHDRQTGATERVSVDSSGNQQNNVGIVGNPRAAISADGRYVAFNSYSTNLVAGDTNGFPDVFVHDRQTGSTERVSVDSAGGQGSHGSYQPKLSADGQYVAFWSWASNLVAGDTNGFPDVFVYDRQTGVTERVSLGNTGGQGNDNSWDAALSADGLYVAFLSNANNLVAGDTNTCVDFPTPGTCVDVFIHDRQTAVTTRVSVDSVGDEGNGGSYAPAISADGRYVAFESLATNLVPGDANSDYDVFVHDLGDADGDGEWDPFDNCPSVATAWFVPAGDTDCDGWSTADENLIGTDPNLACGTNAWPPDFNDSNRVDIFDVNFLKPPVFFSSAPGPPYQTRLDIKPDNVIDIFDVNRLKPVFFVSCTP